MLSNGYLIVNLPVWISWLRWISPYFYGFHWLARDQFVGREFACEGITGPARNACSGTNVLVGLNFPLDTPLYVYPLGLLGFIIGSVGIATLFLQFHHPGGVRYAAQISVQATESEAKEAGHFVQTRETVDVAVRGVGLVVSHRSLMTRGKKVEKAILTGVDAFFPAGEVSYSPVLS